MIALLFLGFLEEAEPDLFGGEGFAVSSFVDKDISICGITDVDW